MDLKHQADASVLQSWGIRVLDTATGASALGAYLLRYSATVHHGKPDFWTSATHLLSWAMASVAIFTSEIANHPKSFQWQRWPLGCPFTKMPLARRWWPCQVIKAEDAAFFVVVTQLGICCENLGYSGNKENLLRHVPTISSLTLMHSPLHQGHNWTWS